MDKTLETLWEMALSDADQALKLAEKLPKSELKESKLINLKKSGNHSQNTWIENLLIRYHPRLEILIDLSESLNYFIRNSARRLLLEKYPKKLKPDFLKKIMDISDKDVNRKAKNLYIKNFC